MPSAPRVVQVTNVAPATTKDQLKTLFGFLGRIDDLVIYPSAESANVTSKVCFVKFAYADDVSVALHLTNTVFIDRALNVVTVPDGRIPDEKTAMSNSYSQNLASAEGTKGDEVERTIYVANLDAAVAPETLMQFFGLHAGEVKYARMAGDEGLPVRAAFIEFSEKSSLSRALALTGQLLGSRPVTVVPSNTAIVKSVSGLEGASSHEIEEALRKVNEAQTLISAAVDSDGSRRKRSRSRSKSRRRSRSRSHSRRSRSHRSRSRKRSRSRSPRSSRQRSKSRSPKPQSSSKSKDRRRHRSRSKSPKPGRSQRSRSQSKGRKNRSDADRGDYSPSHSERDGYGNSRRVSKDDRSQETSRYKSRSSRSKSPVPYGSRKDKDRYRGGLDYDNRKEQELDSFREGKHSKKSGEKRDRDDRKTSSKHRHDEQERKSRKATKHKSESDEDEDDKVEEDERSAAEESNDDERNVEEARSESDRSDADERVREPSDDSSEAAHANLSRMDMDVESD